jgi:DNA mismatch endonuclease (patch repair protein)
MSDVFSKRKRSEIMSAIHGKNNKTTEWVIRSRLISKGIRGWKMNVSNLPGKPDFVFTNRKVAIFVDGCYWHGCSKCRTIPISNRKFWKKKIEGNIKRDNLVNRKLRKLGWKVLHIWEHDIKKNPSSCITRIIINVT